jgi:hypothetical protein
MHEYEKVGVDVSNTIFLAFVNEMYSNSLFVYSI